MAHTPVGEWKQKYLDTLKRCVELECENQKMTNLVNDLRMLCNQQQDELRYFKYKDAGKPR